MSFLYGNSPHDPYVIAGLVFNVALWPLKSDFLKNIQFFRLFNCSELLSPYSNCYELRFCLSSTHRECVRLT